MSLHESEATVEKVYFADLSAEELARSPAGGLPPAVSEALSDPIVQALMAADGIDPEGVEELMRRVIARLSAAGTRKDPAVTVDLACAVDMLRSDLR